MPHKFGIQISRCLFKTKDAHNIHLSGSRNSNRNMQFTFPNSIKNGNELVQYHILETEVKPYHHLSQINDPIPAIWGKVITTESGAFS